MQILRIIGEVTVIILMVGLMSYLPEEVGRKRRQIIKMRVLPFVAFKINIIFSIERKD
jgi:hypothetical protein